MRPPSTPPALLPGSGPRAAILSTLLAAGIALGPTHAQTNPTTSPAFAPAPAPAPTPARAITSQPPAESLEETFKQALFEEEGRRNLDLAIEGYQTVIRALDDQRRFAATAVFRLGECYRKLGRTNDATAQFERILRDFSTEEHLATLSQQNLATLGAIPPAPTSPPTAEPGTSPTPGPSERERLVAALARIQTLEKDPVQQALTVQAFFPDDGLKRMLQRIPKLEAQIQRFRDNPTWKPESVVLPTSPSGELMDVFGELPRSIEDASAILERQKTFIRDHIGPILAIERARLQALETAPSPNTAIPTPFAQAQLQQDLVLLESQLEALSRKPTRELATALPALFPADARGLLDLKSRIADVERRRMELESSLADDHPDRVSLARQLKSLDLRVDQEISDVMAGLRTRLEALKLAHDRLGTLAEKTAPPTTPATPTMTSEEAEEIRRIQALVARSPDLINASIDSQLPPLHTAASKGQLPVALYLLDHGARPDWIFRNQSPLHAATAAGHKAIVELLLDRGASVHTRVGANVSTRPGSGIQVGSTPLHVAAGAGFLAIAGVLLDRGADLNALDNHGSPLHAATRLGRHEMAAFLLEKGADPNARTDGKLPPLADANGPTLEQLLARKADPNLDGGTRLLRAVNDFPTDPRILTLLLQAGANPNLDRLPPGTTKSTGSTAQTLPSTALLRAVEIDHRGAAELLLAAKADPNQLSSHSGLAPIHLAATKDRPDWITWLLDNGANPNLRTANGQPPLELLRLGEGARPRGPVGISIPAVRAAPPTPELPEPVVFPGAAPEIAFQPESQAIATRTAESNRWACVVALLRKGADANLPFSNGYRPAHHLAVWAAAEAFEELTRARADLAAVGPAGLTPLIVAVANDNSAAVSALLAAKVPVDATDEAGNTALHHAAYRGGDRPEQSSPLANAIVRQLLDAGADRQRTNRFGDTPGTLVASRRYPAHHLLGLGVRSLSQTHPPGVLNGNAVRNPELLALLGVPEAPERLPSLPRPGTAGSAPAPRPAVGIPTLSDLPVVGRHFGGKAHVYGAVQRTLDLRPNQRLTLSEVFLESTPPPIANLKAVRIHRAPSGTNTVGETLTVDVEALLRSNDRSQDIDIRPGDRIEVRERVL